MSEIIQDRAILTMAAQWKVVYDLSNGAIFNDLEQPLTQFTPNSVLKFTLFSDAEYLRNGATYRHS